MVVAFRVYKKPTPNGKIVLYLGKREFVDHLSQVDPIDGVAVLDSGYAKEERKIFAQIVCSFRYGREEDETMGLTFQKDLQYSAKQIYPLSEKPRTTKLQNRLTSKLGKYAIPFTLEIPSTAPNSVCIQPGPDDPPNSKPCGVEYYVKVYAGDSAEDRTHKRSTVLLSIKKIQFAPNQTGRQPCTIVRKDFALSPGELELEATLDKQLYYHGEPIVANVTVRNQSNKTVKKIKVSIQQCIDIVLFTNGQYRTTVASVETTDGCPIGPGSSVSKSITLAPSLQANRGKFGVGVQGALKGNKGTELASSTLMANAEDREAFGIIISYTCKVKVYLGALGGELVAELPFVLMNPKPTKGPLKSQGSVAVEAFRSDTIDFSAMSLDSEQM